MKWTLNPDPGEKAKMIAALEKHMNKGGGPTSPTVGESTNSTRNPRTGKYTHEILFVYHVGITRKRF